MDIRLIFLSLLLILQLCCVVYWHFTIKQERLDQERHQLSKTCVYRRPLHVSNKRDYRVVLCVFAGRQDRMSILNTYVLCLLRHGLIDEYHVWNLTRKGMDEAWLRKWVTSAQSCYSHQIRLFEPPVKKYNSFYAHYVEHHTDMYAPDTVFIKMDDDIVYLEMDEFDAFTHYRHQHPEILALSANVVNNGICFHYQCRNNPLCTGVPEIPKHEYPGFGGSLWESGVLTGKLHNWFLRNPHQSFAVQYSHAQPLRKVGDRISINALAWLACDFSLMTELITSTDDERLLSMDLPKQVKRPNVIYGPFVVSHLSFYKQEEDDTFRLAVIPLLITQYQKRADEQTETFLLIPIS